MPIRLTCPSCSATLSVKDEYAGRAVKCPKCGGVIPASQPAAPAAPAAAPPPAKATPAAPPPAEPAPAAAAEKSPFEELDEPAKPAKAGGKITGKPVSRSKDADEDDEDRPRRKGRDEEDEDRPRRKRGEDDEDDRDAKKPAKGKKDDADEDEDKDKDDKPKRKRRDDDDDAPRGRGQKPKKSGSNTGLILLLVGGFLFLCCGGVVGVGYYYFVKVRDAVKDELNPKNDKVTSANYAKIKNGMTKSEVEAILGPGKLATRDKLVWISNGASAGPPNPITPLREDIWRAKIDLGRAYYWQNEGEGIFVGFYPDDSPTARVQMKEFVTKASGKAEADPNYRDDADFVRQFGKGTGTPGKPPKDDPGSAAIEVTADNLAKAYKDDANAADTKYKDKELIVEGKLNAIDLFGDDMSVRLAATGKPVVRCAIQKGEANKVWDTSRGQSFKLRGKCSGGSADFVDLAECKVEGTKGTDPSLRSSAAAFVNEFVKSATAADEKYSEKLVTIVAAVVQSKQGESVLLVGAGPKSAWKIKATWAFGFRKQIENLKPGDTIIIKGEYSSTSDMVININGAWLVPQK